MARDDERETRTDRRIREAEGRPSRREYEPVELTEEAQRAIEEKGGVEGVKKEAERRIRERKRQGRHHTRRKTRGRGRRGGGGLSAITRGRHV